MLSVAGKSREHLQIIEKCRKAIEKDELDTFREIISSEEGLRWMRFDGLNREGLCDEATGTGQRTLVHFACEEGKIRFIRELLRVKASPNVQAKGLPGKPVGETPLHLAVMIQHESCVRLLLDYRAQEYQDSSGKTPLHLAAGHDKTPSNEAIINLLINGRADTNSKDLQGRTAIAYAKEKGKTDVAEAIEKAAAESIMALDKISKALLKASEDGKVQYYVKAWKDTFGLDLRDCHMDQHAAFSVTVASIAQLRDEEILINRHRIPLDSKILDGMACVGGDSLSFMYHFHRGQVVSNEFDAVRFRFLQHNMNLVRIQLGHRCAEQISRMGSVLDMWTDVGNEEDCQLFRQCDVLYLDPEWGGPGYRDAGDHLHLTIAGESLDKCVVDALRGSEKLRWVVLKLPCNYDRDHVTKILESEIFPQGCSRAQGNGCDFGLHATSYRILLRGREKMIFVILVRVKRGSGHPRVTKPSEWLRSMPENLNIDFKKRDGASQGHFGERRR